MLKQTLSIALLSLVPISTSVVAAQQNLPALEKAVADETYKNITSIAASVNNKVIYEKYFNNANKQTLHDVRSASKSITSILFGIALEQGLFRSEHDPVMPVFKDYANILFPNKAKSKMTFHHLLSMTSPLECNDWNSHSAGNEEKMYLRKDWIRFTLDLPERGIPPWEKPASERKYKRAFSYCTAGSFLTGAAIERKSKLNLKQFSDRYLFGPLGIKNKKWAKSPTGIYQGGGGLRLSTQSLLSIGNLMLNKGKWNGKQIISEDWVRRSNTPYSVVMEERDIEYSYLWWDIPFKLNEGSENEKTIRVHAANGNGGNYLIYSPDLNLTAVVTATAYNTNYMHQQTQEIIQKYLIPLASN